MARRKRPMNLGGSTTTTSHASILDSAKARREERALQKQKSDAAASIQAGWRGRAERLRLKHELKSQLATPSATSDVLDLLRAVVLFGDEDVLVAFANRVTPRKCHVIPNRRQKLTSCHEAQLVDLQSRDSSFGILLQQFSVKALWIVSRNPKYVP